jgi:3-demethylubiquinone-9 3-methyltransferase
LNGGANDPFNESVSLLVECDTQEEVDTLWNQLTEGGTEAPCGWLKDRYGLGWQIAPKRLLELVTGDDRKAAAAAMRAMFKNEEDHHRGSSGRGARTIVRWLPHPFPVRRAASPSSKPASIRRPSSLPVRVVMAMVQKETKIDVVHGTTSCVLRRTTA